MKTIYKSLSVIIPAYNEEAGIEACLQAIANQTVMPDEVIVVDNNSSDSTVKLARRFAFVTLVRERRQGLFFARNTGLDTAKGDILARIDADTVVDRDWVASIKRAFVSSEVHAISGVVGYYDMPFHQFVRSAEDRCLRVAKAGRYDFMMGANMALSRQAWQSVRGELCNEPFLFEDIDIAIHLKMQGIVPGYAPKMRALVSARRLADKPADFMKYIGGHTRTWRYHGIRPALGSHFARGIFILVYVGIKPIHMAYDPSLKRLSLTKMFRPSKARPDPMAVEA